MNSGKLFTRMRRQLAGARLAARGLTATGGAFVSQLFIDGNWRPAEAAGTRPIINPFDRSDLTEVAEATAADVDTAVDAAQRAFIDGRWANLSPKQRAQVLAKVAELLQRDKEEIARTETLDTGKTLVESRIDVDDVTAVFSYYADLVAGSAPREVDTGDAGVHSQVEQHPVGVCGLISPWNYPLLQICWKVAPALGAGNSIVVKPSEITPLSTMLLFRLLEEAGVPAGVANLVLGPGDPVGSRLVEHPDVRLVSFTGSLTVGRWIMRAAADGVKKVALELGGKNPNVVFADADFDAAVDFALTAAFLHAGQVCSAGTRLIVQDGIADEFVTELARRAERVRLGNGLDERTESGPLASAEHLAKIEHYVRVGLDEGATLVAGGKRPAEPALADGFFYRPTVFDDCHRGMTVVRDETFGPIITVERFADESEAIFLANDTEYGLAGAVWSSNDQRAVRVANRLRHGTVWINDFGPYLPQAEWGGFKRSGIGRELGEAGLHEYTEFKHVYWNLKPAAQGWFAREDENR